MKIHPVDLLSLKAAIDFALRALLKTVDRTELSNHAKFTFIYQ